MTHPGSAPTGQPEAADDGQPQDIALPLATDDSAGSPKPKSRTGLAIGIVVAVVVVIAGGIGTWVAVGRSGGSGAGSPQDAASSLVADLGNDDVLGVVNDLPPSEGALLRSTLDDAAAQLKRIQAVKPDASSQAATGLSIHADGLKFDSSAVEQVNDHIAITKLVAGKITFGAGLTTNQYTDAFLHAAFPNGAPKGQSTTVDIAKVAQSLGHPVRIATVKVNGRWYPSLFYTIADASLQADHQNWPARSIAPIGSDTVNEASEDFLQAVLDSDAQNAIARTSPDEMAVLHDMGQVLVSQNKVTHDIKIAKITFDDRQVTGGTEAVLRDLTLDANGQQIVIVHANGCYTVQIAGKQQEQLCAGGLADQLRADPVTKSLPSGLIKSLDDMVRGLGQNGVGLVATEQAENWYVDPGRSITQFAHDLEGSITRQDLVSMLQLSN